MSFAVIEVQFKSDVPLVTSIERESEKVTPVRMFQAEAIRGRISCPRNRSLPFESNCYFGVE
jgi:hypothetical protein